MGEEFVKKIKPVGCVMFLLLAILVAAVCLTQGRDPVPGYQNPQSDQYWAGHITELQDELEDNIFPYVDGVTGCRKSDGRLVISIAENDFAVTRAAILRYFDESLFIFEQS